MPIPLIQKIKPLSQLIRIEGQLTDNKSELIVWHYAGIYKNKKEGDQPYVWVGFRELLNDCLSDKMTFRRVLLTALGQARIGTVWKDGISRSMVDFEPHDFNVDFRVDEWRYTSFNSAVKNGTELPYPRHIYPLDLDADKNWLLEFKLPTGGKLVIPCLEFFSRCYGRSQELNRILATFSWKGSENAHESKLYSPINEPEEDGRWKVKLRKRLKNGDTTFLAHAKYDLFTQKAAKAIYAQIEINHIAESTRPLFIQIQPWFQGPAEIKVRGIWFDNHRSFLALQVIGCSDPDGIIIERSRENANKTNGFNPDASGTAWAGASETKLVRPPDIVDLTGDSAPDHDTGSVEVLDLDFIVMGIPRVIVDVYGKKVTDKSGKKGSSDDAATYSSGDPHGSKKGVGYASIHARPIMESHGMLIDMWNAALSIQKKHSEEIKSVDWFTFEHGYQSTGQPKLIGIEPFNEDEDLGLPTATKNWLYYDVAAAQVRGVMIIRLILTDKPIYIIELQRRPRILNVGENQKKESEESLRGFVLMPDSNIQFFSWLKRFMSDVRYQRGIVKKLAPLCLWKADTFSHNKTEAEKIPCEATVLKALKKMGVCL